mmetsp:Transcript_26517/g.49697  ORF Transcript_26517/g.49697 Transcript_26517/m.49697 type:complete len:363 (-) Transcript_26517:407-1495(-)
MSTAMTDEELLDGSSYHYKLTKDMLAASTSNNSVHSTQSSQPEPSSPSHQTPRIPAFLNSPSPQVSFALRQKQYGIGSDGGGNHSSSLHNGGGSSALSTHDLGSSILEYKKEVESHENKKREELLSSQVALLEVYRNKIASNNVTIEEVKQEYEQKMYQQKTELTLKHEEELEALREEEKARQFTDHIRVGAIKDKLKEKYENKIRAFQQDVEDTRTALYNKKLQIQGAVDHANREITTLRLQQESTARIHHEEIQQKEDHISELQGLVNSYKESKKKDEEMIRRGVEVAALVIRMHQKAKPLSSASGGDLDVDELYKYLSSPTASGQAKDDAGAQSIIPSAYLQKAMLSSKKLIQAREANK